MARYIRQKDEYSCAPIALYNAMQWAKGGSNKTHWRWFSRVVKCDEDGTGDAGFLKGIRHLKRAVKVRRLHKPTVKKIREHLSTGGAALAAFAYTGPQEKEAQPHVILLLGAHPQGQSYVAANYHYYRKHAPVSKVPRKLFVRHFQKKRSLPKYPEAWLLSKKSSRKTEKK